MLHALQAEQEGAPWLSVVQPQSGTAVTELSELEQRHWWRLVLLRVEAAGRQAVAQVAPLALGNQLQQSFKVRNHQQDSHKHTCVQHLVPHRQICSCCLHNTASMIANLSGRAVWRDVAVSRAPVPLPLLLMCAVQQYHTLASQAAYTNTAFVAVV
jgi:hypothetical protein